LNEVRLIGGSNAVISTDLELRKDGLPYSNQRQPSDQGAAVYFTVRKNGKLHQMAFACDRWDRIADNIHAIAKTIDALRGVERWGTGSMVEAAFSGFTSLPAPEANKSWRTRFSEWGYVIRNSTDVDEAYRLLAKRFHTDTGGGHEDIVALNTARDEARKELG
jgi:hypothetical protein